MPSEYLAQAEYVDFGLPTTDPKSVRQASALVDAYLRRPEGLQWKPDAAGAPAYMAGLSPSLTLKIAAGVPSGVNVVVPVASGLSLTGATGDVVILDRGTSTACEACTVTTVTKTSITLDRVVNAHASNTTVDFGLVISERQTLPAKRSVARVGSRPIVRLISGLGSYRYGRRIDQSGGLYADSSLLAMMQTFGGPPEWIPFDVTAADFNMQTGEVFIPSGIFLAYYSDVRLYYVAGYSQENIPQIVKFATAEAIRAKLNVGDLAGGVKTAKAGDTMLTRFENSVLDGDTQRQLNLFRASGFA